KTEKNYDGTIQGIISIVKKFENDFGNSESVGIGMPGAVSSDSALVKNANSIWLNGKPFKKDLEKELSRNVNLENDANCFALSEAVDGAGKGHSVVFGVIIGTGTGGGIVVNLKVINGKNNIAGEWGHVSLPNRSEDEKKYVNKCYCEKNGCMETYVSGPGFASGFNLRHNTNHDSHTIIEEFNNNEQRAIAALDNYVDHLARGLSLVCNILDPDIIVLGGGMSNISYIYENINNTLKKNIFSNTFDTKVVKNIHGDSGGVRGAAWLS
ncbi:MAG: ROK family protein, partial [Pelagibacteraceae bacterium]|nr:ROK family protein [Pelagibacteraceae bacterium]